VLPALETPKRRALLIQAENRSVEDFIPSIPRERFDLAVLPEYAYFKDYTKVLNSPRGPVALAKIISGPVIFGAVKGEFGEQGFENVAVVLDARGKPVGTFTKQRPVPLFMDGVAGTERPVFPLADLERLGVAICYDFDAPEIAGTLVRNGATVLALPTYDAMSWGVVQHQNHELLVRLRAVENDRWILRAASSGRSEAVNPHGFPSQEGLDIGQEGYVVVAFDHRHSVPLGGQTHLLGPSAAVATVLLLIVHFLMRYRKARSSDSPKPLS
jgi:apolipoprotein N-acyltransferase